MKIWNWLNKYWHEIAVVMLAAGFFVATSAFIHATQTADLVKWSSPDETANYFFAKHYAETGEMFFYENLNAKVGDVIYPRSMRSDQGVVKPVSFLGIIFLYGQLANFYSISILPYLTPFFAALGIIFYYLLVKKIFGRAPAFVSTFVLAIFPVYFYYTVRSFFHNILFIDFLIAGLYFAVLASAKGQKNHFFSWRLKDLKQMNWAILVFSALAGLCLGFSMTVRASEALWLFPALGLAWLFNVKKFGLLKLALIVSFAALAFLPQVYWNKVLYGDFKNGGYSEMNTSISAIATQSSTAAKTILQKQTSPLIESLKKIKKSVFFFGFFPDKAFEAFDKYFIKMFSWLFWSTILGIILFLLRFGKSKSRHWAWFLSWILSSLILVLYYGSWQFHDNPDPKDITIGNSYTRYWLPIYLGAMPFAAFFFLRLTWAVFARDEEENYLQVGWRNFWSNFFSAKKPGRDFSVRALRAASLIVLAFICFNFVFSGSKEGLVYAFLNQKNSLKEYREVLSLTEENSVIITQYHDKLLFPKRRVVVGAFADQNLNSYYFNLLNYTSVYYYNFNLPDKNFEYLNERKLQDSGLRLTKIKKVNSAFALYKLEKK